MSAEPISKTVALMNVKFCRVLETCLNLHLRNVKVCLHSDSLLYHGNSSKNMFNWGNC